MYSSSAMLKSATLAALILSMSSCAVQAPQVQTSTSLDVPQTGPYRSPFSDALALMGHVQFPQKFRTKAVLADLTASATVSLLYPPDHPLTPNQTIATGLTNASGMFTINPSSQFQPQAGEIFLLEASKRVGGTGKAQLTVRTYVQRTAAGTWSSITSSGIQINALTTALAIMDSWEGDWSASQTIGTIQNGIPTQIIHTLPEDIQKVSQLIEFLLLQDLDPAEHLRKVNGFYTIQRPGIAPLTLLQSTGSCLGCDLSGLDLSHLNLSNADLRGANLFGANLSGTVLTQANLSGATWTNGDYCVSGSVGSCVPGPMPTPTPTAVPTAEPSAAATPTPILTPSPLNLTPYQVNAFASFRQENPQGVMARDGKYILVWQSEFQDGDEFGIFARRYDSSGNPLGNEFQVNQTSLGNQISPNVVSRPDGSFSIFWMGPGNAGNGQYMRHYNAAGTPISGEIKIVDAWWIGFSNALLSSTKALLPDSNGISFYSLDGLSKGTFVAPVTHYALGDVSRPVLDQDSTGNLIAIWQQTARDGSGAGIYAQRFESSAARLGPEFKVNTTTQYHQYGPQVAMHSDGSFVVGWVSQESETQAAIYAQRFNAAGDPVGGEFKVSGNDVLPYYGYSNYYSNYSPLALKMDATGNFTFFWLNSEGKPRAQKYQSNGSPLGAVFEVGSHWQSLITAHNAQCYYGYPTPVASPAPGTSDSRACRQIHNTMQIAAK